MKHIFLLLAFLNVLVVSAADITLTSTPAISPYQNGELLIEMDPLIVDIPFTVSVSGPNGYQSSQQIPGYSLTLTGLAPGLYCVQVVAASGCLGNVCVSLESCTYKNGTYFCHPTSVTCCEGDIVVSGTPFGGMLVGGEGPEDFHYTLYNGVDSSTFILLEDAIADTTWSLVSQLLSTGSTSYDTAYQDVLQNTDATFVLLFDSFGDIQWIWHQLPGGVQQSTLPVTDLQLYPNPVSDEVFVSWSEPGQFVRIMVLDLWSHVLMRHELGQDRLEFTLPMSQYPPGMYYVYLTGLDGQTTVRSVVRMDN